jgi:HAD superfamily hydrolase (TIGR01459 family)
VRTTPEALVLGYEGFLLDAYGVLNDGAGSLAIGQALMGHIHRAGKPFAIVTNDASRSPSDLAARFAAMGYSIAAAQIVTAGDMLTAHLQTLAGDHAMRAVVLGTAASRAYASAGGVALATLSEGADADMLILCDDEGFEFKLAIEWSLSMIVRRLEQGRTMQLLLANPDLTYPKNPSEIGITAGGMAGLIEQVLRERFGPAAPRFSLLGKPHPAILEAGMRTFERPVPSAKVVMIGDQLSKDVAAARAAGVDSAWITSAANAKLSLAHVDRSQHPTWVLEA